jgi:glycosyltransferase 2 family protein
VRAGISKSVCAVIGSPWVKVAGTLAGVALLIHMVDIPKAVASLGRADPRWIAAALALTAVAVVASVVEWGVLLRTSPSPAGGHLFAWRRLSSSYLQSLFFTQVLPAGVGGDAMRTVEMGRQVGHGRVLASLAGSRMAGMLGMACWGLAAAVLLRDWLGTGIVMAIGGLAATMVVVWTGALSADRVVPHRAVTRVWKRLGGALNSFSQSFADYRAHPHAVAQCLLVGAAGWGINLFALSLAAKAVGVDLSWTVLAVCIPLTLLVALVPFSINGLGVREGVLVWLLAHVGVSTANAGAVTLLIDLQMMPFAVLGLVLWMRRRRETRFVPVPIPVPIQ